ncbi:hypothetical protein EC988_000425 [Linderina pennispora]|nr:hypothetical protein EC988_000425 [Linderina pennispora]
MVTVLETCQQLLGSAHTSAETQQLCQVVDQLGQKIIMGKSKNSLSLLPFTRYLEFYAQLGRPDITQLAFSRIRRQWRQPSISVYSAQQRALLRFAADRASGLQLLACTISHETPVLAAQSVESRLIETSVRQIVEDALAWERRTRRLVKVFEYGSYSALAMLIAKWTWIGNSVVLAGMGVVPKAAASAAVLGVSAAIVRMAVKHSVMGSLTVPALAETAAPHTANTVQAQDGESEARRILSRAFPASPSDEAMMEISEILKTAKATTSQAMSWKLRLALMWSRFARRFAIVEPVLMSDRALTQRLCVLWARNITQMVPSDVKSGDLATEAVCSEALLEWIAFVKRENGESPLVLGHDGIVDSARFAARHTDANTIKRFLEFSFSGALSLMRGLDSGSSTHLDEQSMNQAGSVVTVADSRVAMSAADNPAHRTAATILVTITIVNQLLNQARESRGPADPASCGKLSVALNTVLASESCPIPVSLYYAAFRAAAVLNDTVLSDKLAQRFRASFVKGDPYIAKAARSDRDSTAMGWRLGSVAPTNVPPIVRCVSPYLSMLAQQDVASNIRQDAVCELIKSWNKIGLLDHAAATMALVTAVKGVDTTQAHRMLVPTVQRWMDLGQTIFSGVPQGTSTTDKVREAECARALYYLATCVMELGATAGHLELGFQAHSIASESIKQRSYLETFAPSDYNEQSIRVFSSMAEQHAPSEQSQVCVHMAISVLDQMRTLGQTPQWQTFDALCVAAAKSYVDIENQVSVWTKLIKDRAQAKKLSNFAKSL